MTKIERLAKEIAKDMMVRGINLNTQSGVEELFKVIGKFVVDLNSKTKGKSQPGVTNESWNAYSDAYRARYGVSPVSNTATRSKLKQIVQRIGLNDTPELCKFYLTQSDYKYVQSCHAVGLLLLDCEGLFTRMRANYTPTTRNTGREQSTDQAIKNYLRRRT